MMHSRVIALAAALCLSGASLAQTPPAPTTQYNVKFDNLKLNDEFSVVQQVVRLAPGAKSAVHMHGGTELVLVTQGAVTLTLDADGSSRTYRAGETYSVPAGQYLQVENNTNEDAAFVVTFLLPKGATLTTPKS